MLVEFFLQTETPLNGRTIKIDLNIKENAYYCKNSTLGFYTVEISNKKFPIKTPVSIKIISINEEFTKKDCSFSEQFIKSQPIFTYENCTHDMIINSLCWNCREEGIERPNDKIIIDPKETIIRGVYSKESENEKINQLMDEYIKQGKLLLILDIDNTIIEFSRENLNNINLPNTNNVQHQFMIAYPMALESNPNIIEYSQNVVFVRPHLMDFLNEISKLYEIFVYTMATRSYAEQILRNIDPDQKILSTARLISREKTSEGKKTIEDIVNEKYFSHVIILDDSRVVWVKHLRNLIKIKPFEKVATNPVNDHCLYFMKNFLKRMHQLFFKFLAEECLKQYADLRVIKQLCYLKVFSNLTIGLSRTLVTQDNWIYNCLKYKIKKHGGQVLSNLEDNALDQLNFLIIDPGVSQKTKTINKCRKKMPIIIKDWVYYSINYLQAPISEPELFDAMRPLNQIEVENKLTEERLMNLYSPERLKKINEELNSNVELFLLANMHSTLQKRESNSLNEWLEI